MVENLNQVSWIKKWYNPQTVVLVMVSLISLIAYLTLETTTKDLLFKSLFLIAFGPIAIALAVGIIFSTRTYPSRITFDFEKERIFLGGALTINFDELEIGLVHSKFGFIGMELVLVSGQEYIYRNFFTCNIDETEFASLLKNIPSIKYIYENKI
ncbi:hypothetical protein [Idiomarina sp.]|uniref:hypothetical protein n=1 Tax=Idiomarina sp. TaxID=1874361 RepID=UPI0025C0FA68|nr:hypothetical protein [Idiomarina sp.]